MKIPLRIKLLVIWYKFFRSSVKPENLIKISKKGKGVKKVLYFLPSEKHLAQVAAHFIKPRFRNNNLHIDYVLHEDGLNYYQDELLPQMILLNDRDFNWFGAVISKNIIDKINSIKYDALIDLNQSVNQTLSLLSMELDIPIKVGFETVFPDQLYSIVIEPQKNGFLEENYIMIERMLGIT